MDELFSAPELAEFPLGLHLAMIQDPVRMRAFDQALRVAISPGDVVVDVGAGTGVLSLP